MKRPLYKAIACRLDAIRRLDKQIEETRGTCEPSAVTEEQKTRMTLLLRRKETHEAALEKCEKELPSGSGFDSGTKLDKDKSDATRLVFTTSFHHMDAHGFYSGWTDHKVTIRASLQYDFDMITTGRNRNDILSYIADTFDHALKAEVEY